MFLFSACRRNLFCLPRHRWPILTKAQPRLRNRLQKRALASRKGEALQRALRRLKGGVFFVSLAVGRALKPCWCRSELELVRPAQPRRPRAARGQRG